MPVYCGRTHDSGDREANDILDTVCPSKPTGTESKSVHHLVRESLRKASKMKVGSLVIEESDAHERSRRLRYMSSYLKCWRQCTCRTTWACGRYIGLAW